MSKEANPNPKLVLFSPRRWANSNTLTIPLDCLAVARLPVEAGFEVVLIDADVNENFQEAVMKHCADATCLGITATIGEQVLCGAETARAVNKQYPDLPIIWGGWFSSVKPGLLISNGLADIVVRGQGELTLKELIACLYDGSSYESIPGITFKKNGKIVTNPDRPLLDLNTLPKMPYHLIDLEPYLVHGPFKEVKYFHSLAIGKPWEEITHIRIISYYGSWGCPNACNFCCSACVTKKRVTMLDIDVVLDDLEDLHHKYQFNHIHLSDANFFFDAKRVRRFCEGLIQRKLDFYWGAAGEVGSIVHYEHDLLDLMAESKCYALFLGAESACRETLELMKKPLRPEETPRCVELLTSRKISVHLSYVIGFPDEPPESTHQTVKQAREIKLNYPSADIVFQYFLPLPGSGIYQRALELGFKEPPSMEGWAFPIFSEPSDAWFKETDNRQLKILYHCQCIYFPWSYDRNLFKKNPRLIDQMIQKFARMRLKTGILAYPIEFKILAFLGLLQ